MENGGNSADDYSKFGNLYAEPIHVVQNDRMLPNIWRLCENFTNFGTVIHSDIRGIIHYREFFWKISGGQYE